MEGPKAPSEARRREAPRGRVWEGRRSPSSVWVSGGFAPRKFFKFNVQIYAFSCYFCVKHYAESDDVQGSRVQKLNYSFVVCQEK